MCNRRKIELRTFVLRIRRLARVYDGSGACARASFVGWQFPTFQRQSIGMGRDEVACVRGCQR
jgi:hypothetical protein